MDTEIVVPKSKGQIYKENYGWSKTMKRNMKRNGIYPSLEGVEAYSKIRAEKRVQQRKLKKDKHTQAKLNRKQKVAKQPAKK